ncbi:MAG: cyanophycin synthetase [Gammaproteobacteria bacterium]|nr:cyanophycin synthetase [Gammaproteobacteria bacterium]
MQVERVRALRGPNLWTRRCAIQALVTCEEAERDLRQMGGFVERLRALYPQLPPLAPAAAGSTLSLANVLEVAALGLQTLLGCPVSFAHTAAAPDVGVSQVVVEYVEEAIGLGAFALAQRLIEAALDALAFDLDPELNALGELYETVRLGPSTGAIVTAAVERGIPFRRLTSGSLVQFGWGSRQRRIQAAEMDRTSAIAQSIAQDKQLTKELLRAAGVPVPEGQTVLDAAQAWSVACALGLPVVVKPQDGNQGRGVTVNIETREHLEQAFQAAAEAGTQVLVERYIAGSDYRLLVIGDKLIAAARREPPQVIGDGVRSVQELVEEVNRDPRRGEGHATSLTRIRLDDIARACLQLQNCSPETIPALGQRVIMRNNANLSTGGTATDVTDEVHPELAARAVTAAQMVGLEICGVDIVCQSVRLPLEEQAGGVVEVNAAPGLRMHLAPSFGTGRRVGEAIVAEMFAPGDDARIPVVAVTGTNGKTTTVRLIAHLLARSGLRVGMTTTDGVFVDGRQMDAGDCSGPRSARSVLMHPEVDAAVFETARGGILRAGLAFDRCRVAVVTNIGRGDHLGLNFITTVEDLAVLKRVIVQNVAPTGHAVLNADDPITARLGAACPGSVIFFSRDHLNPIILTHRAQGRPIVLAAKDAISCAIDGEEICRLALAAIPLTMGGRIGFQIANVMAAIGAVWALGLEWSVIKDGLATFISDAASTPGRFNLMAYRGATVIADYGHNPDAMTALVDAVVALPAARRSVVISGAGDRRDEDITNQTRILGEVFDSVVLYQDACQRGRADGEVLALLRTGLANASRTREITEIRGEFIAIDAALAALRPGDLCLILIDQVDEALAHLAQRVAEAATVS